MIKLLRKINSSLNEKIRWLAGQRAYKWVVSDWIKLTDLEVCAKVLMTEKFSVNLHKIIREPPKGKILVLAPHQDDETIGAGGTLLLAAKSGAKITCAYITDGSLADKNVPKDQMAKIREEEAKKVWETIGGKPVFLRYPDCGIPLNREAANRLASLIKEESPNCIFIPFLLDISTDHRRTNHLLWLTKEEGLPNNIEVWAYQVWAQLIPNVLIDITDVMSQKNKINSLWISQNKVMDYVHYTQGMNAYNSKYLYSNKPLFIEIFFVVPLFEYFKLLDIYYNRPLNELYNVRSNW